MALFYWYRKKWYSHCLQRVDPAASDQEKVILSHNEKDNCELGGGGRNVYGGGPDNWEEYSVISFIK